MRARAPTRRHEAAHGRLYPIALLMKTYIALFRGINVGGKHVLPMKELVASLEDVGCSRVRTYIQSGNAVFESKERDAPRLSGKICARIKERRGFDPFVLLIDLETFERAIAANPFPEGETDPKTLHISFLISKPTSPAMKALEALKKETERFHLAEDIFYLHAPEGIGRSKLAASVEKLLGVPMTDRNWRTVCAVRDLARGRDGAAGKATA